MTRPEPPLYTLLLQTAGQSISGKLAAYHADRSLGLFPAEGFGDKATEVLGPNGFRRCGRCLLQIDNVTARAKDILAWHSQMLICRYVNRIFMFDAAKPAAASREELLASLARTWPAAGAVRLQCDPRSFEKYLEQTLPLKFELDPRGFAHVLDVVELDGGSHPPQYLYALRPAAHFWRLPPDLAAAYTSCSRAYLKIEELFRVLRLEQLPPGSAAIDLGAAPGGWTGFLARQGCRVLAVDPAELDPQVAAHESVVHIRQTSQLAGAALEAELRQRHGGSAAILLSDMNTHPQQAATAMAPLLRHLALGSWVVLTLKLRGAGRDRSSWLARLPELLGHKFRTPRLLWLLANTNFETTFVGQLSAW